MTRPTNQVHVQNGCNRIGARVIKRSMGWSSRIFGVPVIIWVATGVGFVAGVTSGIATGNIWITAIGGIGAGTAILAPFLVRSPMPDEDLLIYNSDDEDPAFASWTYYAEYGVSPEKFHSLVTEDGKKALGFISRKCEVIGPNKSVALLAGVLEFDYMISSPDRTQGAFFAILPMQETGPNRTGLIEAGSSRQDDPVNPGSQYRIRYFVPREHYNDQKWHHRRMEFNFDGVPNIFYTIFAPRVNEGLAKRSTLTEVVVTGVRVWRGAKPS